MHISARPGGAAAVEKIVLHLNAGPEVEGGAQSLVSYLQTIDGGYHEVVDDKHVVVVVGPDKLVYGAAGMNTHGYHICVIGEPQSAAQWADTYSAGELDLAAQRVAAACHTLNVPPVQLTDPQVALAGVKGVCDHWAVNRAIQHGDHIDVGPNFPWSNFMAKVREYFNGGNIPNPKPPIQEDDAMSIICERVASTVADRSAFVNFDPATKTLTGYNGVTFATGADPKEWKVTVWPKNDGNVTGTAQLLTATNGRLGYDELPDKNGVVITADGDGGTFSIGYHELLPA